MVLEHALIDIRPGTGEAFEAALAEARQVIAASPGFAPFASTGGWSDGPVPAAGGVGDPRRPPGGLSGVPGLRGVAGPHRAVLRLPARGRALRPAPGHGPGRAAGPVLMGRLEGHRALVTGAGSGIGRATCLLLAAEGATVAALDLDAGSAAQVAKEVGGPAVVADMADADAVADAVAQAVAELGGLSLLVNNAGVGPGPSVPQAQRPRLRPGGRRLHAGDLPRDPGCGPGHAGRGGGSIVNVSSDQRHPPDPGRGGRTRRPRPRSSPSPSRPPSSTGPPSGSTACPRVSSTHRSPPRPRRRRRPGRASSVGPRSGRVGTAGEVASVVAFLCSTWSTYITGVNVPVDGGACCPAPRWRSRSATWCPAG